MAAPAYSPAGGEGTWDNGYLFTGGRWVPQFSSGGGQVKGATTSSGGGGGTNYQYGGWYDGRQWDGSRFGNPGEIIVGGNSGGGGDSGGGGGGGGGEPDYSQMISEMYEPALALTREAEKNVRDEYETDVKNLEARIDDSLGDYMEQQGQLLGDTQTEENKFNKVLKSALSEAIRAYNALNQQRFARFGAGSSAGQAVGELAQQEFFRQQGNVQERGVEGAQQFAQERARIRSYITDRLDKLKLYKEEALSELKKNLNSQIEAIAARRGDIEANKTRDKLAVLQNAMERTREIERADKEFRRNLGLAAVQQLQQIQGKAFTPQEIRATLAEFGVELPNLGPGGGQAGTAPAVARRPLTQDELAQLSGAAVQGGGALS